jgi:hypothetical protein
VEFKAGFKSKEVYPIPVDISISRIPEDPEQEWDFKSFSFAKDLPHLLHVYDFPAGGGAITLNFNRSMKEES